MEDAIKFLPTWLQHFIAENGIDAGMCVATRQLFFSALDLTYELTRAYTNPNVYSEMQGIADASGVNFYQMRRVHMVRFIYHFNILDW